MMIILVGRRETTLRRMIEMIMHDDDGGDENVDYDSNLGEARHHLEDNVDGDHDDSGSEC